VVLPYEALENGYFSNSDGTGVCIADGKALKIHKGADWSHEDAIKILEKNAHLPAIVHFRMASHGAVNNENTHPFHLSNGWGAAHNGIIQIPILDAKKSDTREYLDRYVNPLLKSKECLSDQAIVNLIGKSIGSYNKIAFLHKTGAFSIANEASGHWTGGAWFSNDSYKSNPYLYDDEKDALFNSFDSLDSLNESPFKDSALF